MKYFLPALKLLLRDHTVIAYDPRGRAESAAPGRDSAPTAEGDIADLEAVRSHFHLARLKLVGHHWGAALAALYALRWPDRVERIVMLSPFVVHPSLIYEIGIARTDSLTYRATAEARRAIRRPEDWLAFCASHWEDFFSPMLVDPALPREPIARELCDVPSEVLMRVERINRSVLGSLGSWSWRTALNKLPTPVLVIEGNTFKTEEEGAVRWAQHLPDGRVMILEAPVLFPWIGQAGKVADATREFLRGRIPAGAVKPPPFKSVYENSAAVP